MNSWLQNVMRRAAFPAMLASPLLLNVACAPMTDRGCVTGVGAQFNALGGLVGGHAHVSTGAQPRCVTDRVLTNEIENAERTGDREYALRMRDVRMGHQARQDPDLEEQLRQRIEADRNTQHRILRCRVTGIVREGGAIGICDQQMRAATGNTPATPPVPSPTPGREPIIDGRLMRAPQPGEAGS